MSTSPPAAAAAAAVPMGARARGALLILCGAIFLEGIDVAMLNVALPAIRAELGLSTTTLSAVVSAYVLGYAGFMLLGGRAADLFGKRRMFLAALTVFLVFSGLGGFATEGWMLLVARFVTGMAAAFMTPAGLALITTNFAEGPQRNKAVLIYAATASAGFSLGLVAGGFLLAISWRWPSSRSSGARPRRWSASACCEPGRWSAAISARCCSPAPSSASSSWCRCTCRSCAAGPRWRPASPCWRSASTRSWPRR